MSGRARAVLAPCKGSRRFQLLTAASASPCAAALRFVRIRGDYFGRVAGQVVELGDNSSALRLTTEPAWGHCTVRRQLGLPGSVEEGT